VLSRHSQDQVLTVYCIYICVQRYNSHCVYMWVYNFTCVLCVHVHRTYMT
jgi:hypothetical protein